MSIKLKDQNNNEIFIAGTNSEDFINDKVLRNDKTWSSNKIVEELYPTFQKEGNPIICYPVENYPLNVKATFLPKQAGTGDPSPDNVRPITGRDEVTVTRCGKNLLNGECVAANLFNKDGTPSLTNLQGTTLSSLDVTNLPIHVEQTLLGNPGDLVSYQNGYFAVATPQEIPDGAQLTISMKIRVTSALSQELSTWAVLLKGVEVVTQLQVSPTSQEEQTISYSFKYSDGTTASPETRMKQVEFRISGMSFDILEIQLEVGSTPTAYEPYQGSTTTLTLPETIYGGTVDAVSGVGSKEWGFIASYSGEALPGEWISDRDVYSPGTTPTTGAQVAYKLATPEPFQATGAQPIPALAGENTVYTDGDNLIISGKENIKYTINQIISNIQNINQIQEINNILLGVE